jgi:alpha-methylacyl-CoA racemase
VLGGPGGPVAEPSGADAVSGPLAGVRVIELAGLGPAPFGAMVLADLGADVVRVDRADRCAGGNPAAPPADVLQRGRRSIGVDLKRAGGVETVMRLVERADVLIEGFRPGVCERLGLGPDVCLARNPRIVFGRMTGWGQDGPLASTAGHDIDYIALSGALGAIGRRGERPVPPLNLVGDFGGGGMFLALGVVCALFEAQRSGRGQVVDAAMVDGSALLMTMMHAFRAMGVWDDERGVNVLDTGAGFYEVYETADGRYLAVGAIEAPFYAELLEGLGLTGDPDLPAQYDKAAWPAMTARFAEVIRTRTRNEWEAAFAGTDACVAPVLSMAEAPEHPHNAARGTFVERFGVVQAAPAPRLSRTPGALDRPPAFPGQHTDEVLDEWGFTADERAELRAGGAVA